MVIAPSTRGSYRIRRSRLPELDETNDVCESSKPFAVWSVDHLGSGSGFIPVDGICSTRPRLAAANAETGAFLVGLNVVSHAKEFSLLNQVGRGIERANLSELSSAQSVELPAEPRKSWNEISDCLRRWRPRERDAVEEWSAISSKIGSFRNLPSKWDGYCAPSPSERAVAAALRFIQSLKACNFVPTRVMPSVVGGIGITFRHAGRKVYFEFYNSGKALMLFSDGVSDPQIRDVQTTGGGFLSSICQAREYLDEPTSGRDVPTQPASYSVLRPR